MNRKNILPLLLLAAVGGLPAMARENRLIDDSWTFTLTPDSASGIEPYTKIVNLPHDWSMELPFAEKADCGTEGGYVYAGKGKYTKDITLTANELANSKYSLLFEGVYERWTLKVNGETVGFRPYGYSSVIYDITPYLHAGKNEIEVTVDNSNQRNCRWFTGSGIYRHVRLIKTGEIAVAPWSLYITTPEVSNANAKVDFSFDIDGKIAGKSIEAKITVRDSDGRVVAEATTPVKENQVNGSVTVKTPKLWSPETPTLYSMAVDLTENGKTIDNIDEIFGIRTIEYSAEKGFLLNGKPVDINGACVHHDHGLLGAAAFDAAEARKVKLLKEGGFNAVRTSHNPTSSKFLEECDRQGLLVIDEAFDGWRDSKTPNDYHLWIDEWGTKDLGDLVRRDRNHPSIIAWSIGNEVIERKHIGVVTTARKFVNECHKLDPTRPVTEALCAWDSDWEIFDPHAEELDIVGYNYMIFKSESDHARCPERIMWQTESYPRDAAANWHKVTETPYVIGDFVWTGMDYLGESGIGRYYYEGETPGEHWQNPQWPWHGAYCGDIDITGWRKPISHYRDMLYNGDEKLYMAVKEPDGYNGKIHNTMWSVWPTWESWNWPGHEGKPIDVEVQSRYPKVRLYLDDRMIGEATPKDYMAVFTTNYAPGVLKAVGLDEAGNEKENVTLATTGEPAAIRLTPDKTVLASDEQDLVYVIAEVVDKEGRVVPDAALPIKFNVTGGAAIQGAGNADLTAKGSYQSPDVKSWKGRAMVVLRSNGKKGAANLKATSPSLKGSSVKIKTN